MLLFLNKMPSNFGVCNSESVMQVCFILRMILFAKIRKCLQEYNVDTIAFFLNLS